MSRMITARFSTSQQADLAASTLRRDPAGLEELRLLRGRRAPSPLAQGNLSASVAVPDLPGEEAILQVRCLDDVEPLLSWQLHSMGARSVSVTAPGPAASTPPA